MEYITQWNTNLYSSITIGEAVAVIIEILNNDNGDLRKRMNLTRTSHTFW